jgi:hypothetical protein
MTFDDLRAKYPRILRQTFGFECEVGWIRILDDYFAVVDREMPADATYELRQIKEKLGSLRIYDYGPATDNPKVQEAHRLAEARSFHTCEKCGRPGVWSNRRGLLITVCEEHALDPDFGRAEPIESGDYTYRDESGDWWVYDTDADALVKSEAPDWAR